MNLANATRSLVPRVKPLLVCLLAFVLLCPQRSEAYAVLAHEAIIDVVWETHLKPLLKSRFPDATEEQFSGAQAYAYGGAIIQDMGYYPHGSHLFSDLTHYVRSGDFILALLRDAKDLNGYAFALGALSHYAADNNGHRIATNRAVPFLYPKLKKKYGSVVVYEDDPLAHVKTEFGFDVLEVARERYAPDSYHDFIGFEVATPLVEQAFRDTYGIELKRLMDDEERALGSYRRAVSKTIPQATHIAWHLKKDEIQNDSPGLTKRKFLYNLSRAGYEKDWGKKYQKPTLGEKFLAFLYRLIPKFGPLRVLQFRTPTPETEKLFEESFNETVDRYRALLQQTSAGMPVLPNNNFDVGGLTGPGAYRLNDDTHATLLEKLAEDHFSSTPPEVRAELLQFYSDSNAAYSTKRDPKAWDRVQTQLEQLKSSASASVPVPLSVQPSDR